VEGQTDMRKLIVAFPNVVNAPKNRSHGLRPAETGSHNPSPLLLSPPNTRSNQRMEWIALHLIYKRKHTFSRYRKTNALDLERTDNLRNTQSGEVPMYELRFQSLELRR